MAEDFGRLVLRLGVGGLMLFHGVHKLLTGLDGIKVMLSAHHLSDALAYVVYFGEIVGPLLVIFGVFARVGALLIAAELAALVALSHAAQLLDVAPDGGYFLETPVLYIVGALAVLLLGPGKLAIARGRYQ